MIEPTQTQTELLRIIAAGDTGISVKEADSEATKALIKAGWLLSTPIAAGDSRLIITAAGRAAISMVVLPPPERSEDRPASTTAPASSAPSKRPGGKLGILLDLLSRSDGATLEQMTEATGWQAHSVRGAMSGALKKKLGLSISSEKVDDARIYQIAAEVTA